MIMGGVRLSESESLILSLRIWLGLFVALGKLTSENSANRFPPHWDPPPRVGYGERKPEPLDVLAGLLANETDSWLIELYSKKLAFRLGLRPPGTMPDEEFEKLVDVLEQLPDGKQITERVYSQQWFGEDADISAERRALIEGLRLLADVEEDQVESDGPFPFHFRQDSND